MTLNEGAEYTIEAMIRDPDSDPTSSLIAQRHRRHFHESGLNFMLELDQGKNGIQIIIFRVFFLFWLSKILCFRFSTVVIPAENLIASYWFICLIGLNPLGFS